MKLPIRNISQDLTSEALLESKVIKSVDLGDRIHHMLITHCKNGSEDCIHHELTTARLNSYYDTAEQIYEECICNGSSQKELNDGLERHRIITELMIADMIKAMKQIDFSMHMQYHLRN